MSSTSSVSCGNWQNVLDDCFTEFEHKCLSNEFNLFHDNEQRIGFLLRKFKAFSPASWIDEYFTSCFDWKFKSEDKAVKLRQQGNDQFQKKKFQPALACYNKCINIAPFEGACLPLALGNRSAVLYHLKEYVWCLADIEEAVQLGYPSQTAYKLYQRRAQCYIKLGQTDFAKESFQHVLDIIQSQNCDNMKKESIKSEVSQHLSKMQSNFIKQTKVVPDMPSVSNLSHGSHTLLLSASSALSLNHTSEKGRHILANRDIDDGDTLIVEEPFCSIVLPQFREQNCHHCCDTRTAYPCPYCDRVMFCTPDCRAKAVYHRFECLFLPLLDSIGIAHLSLRIVLTAGIKAILDFLKFTNETQSQNTTNEMYRSSDYCRVYELIEHGEETSEEDIFSYAMTSLLLLRVLESSGAIVLNPPHNAWSVNSSLWQTSQHLPTPIDKMVESVSAWNTPTVHVNQEQYIQLGGVLLKHILQLICNGTAITNIVTSPGVEGQIDNETETRVATAIYPTASLLNHSCDPNITASHVKNILVIRANRRIKKGSEIYNCYGPDYKRMSVQERKEILNTQYHFDCHCEPCLTQPLYTLSQALLCVECQGPVLPMSNHDPATYQCKICGHVRHDIQSISQFENFNEPSELFLEAEDLEDSGKMKDAISTLEECYMQQSAILYKHNRRLAEILDFLAKGYASTGDYKESFKAMQKQLVITQAIYGDASLEVGHELQKMAEIAFNDQNITGALEMIERAMAIYTKHYYMNHVNILDCVKMKKCLLDVLKSAKI